VYTLIGIESERVREKDRERERERAYYTVSLSGLLTERPVPHQHRPSTAPTGQVDQQVCEQRQLFQCFYPVLEIVKSVRFETFAAAVQLFVPV